MCSATSNVCAKLWRGPPGTSARACAISVNVQRREAGFVSEGVES
jgi:hypothetical protein